MTKFLKLLLEKLTTKTEKIKVTETYNRDLVLKIIDLSYKPEVDQVVSDPVSKICLINTYSSNFEELVQSLVSGNKRNMLLAVNLHSYFKKNTNKVTVTLSRIVSVVESRTFPPHIVHDLNEVLDTLEYLSKLKR